MKVVVLEQKRRRNRRKWKKEEHGEGVMEGRRSEEHRKTTGVIEWIARGEMEVGRMQEKSKAGYQN